ncbi:MAG: bifunctional isocitrate dehydrogenase kinase/phosphatase [Bacteroidota bacterium]
MSSNSVAPDARIDRIATVILKSYQNYHHRYVEISSKAGDRFSKCQWNRLRTDGAERLGICPAEITSCIVELRSLMGKQVNDKDQWAQIKSVYGEKIPEYEAWEIAKTFFNSITRRLFDGLGVDEYIQFAESDFANPPEHNEETPVDIIPGSESAKSTLKDLIQSARIPGTYPPEQLEADIALLASRLNQRLTKGGGLQHIQQIQYLSALFYRGKRCYLIARVFSGAKTCPMVIAFRNWEDGVQAEAVMLEESDVSKLFSFARSYFHTNIERPYEVIEFLSQLMPRKRRGELYISLGYTKHGKTELYRNLQGQLRYTNEQWQRARGTEGMVMSVFTMPSYDMVIKVIKDRFNEVKSISKKEVKEKYKLVYHHHRAGRLVDTQSFQHLALPKDRFSDEILETLLTKAGDSIAISEDGTQVLIAFAYLQRRVIPLDIYIREASEQQITEAVIDYGHAIKDLARCNIYPGDMMLKNFGVTRHGRVVFYDYDEINLVTNMKFREMPEAQSYGQAIAPEPWFRVDREDVFPIELKRFLGMPKRYREIFEAHHSDLYTPEFWQRQQKKIKKGLPQLSHPFREELRLRTVN